MEARRAPRLSLPAQWLSTGLSPWLSWAGLLACAAPVQESPPPPIAAEALYEYEVAATRLPAGARELELCLILESQAGVRLLGARGLIGNAAFEQDFAREGPANSPVAFEPERGGTRLVRATTAGRPLELSLRLACAEGLPPAELVRALDGALTLSVDGQAQEPASTRLRRVR